LLKGWRKKMKVVYKSDYEQFPGGVIKPRERLEVEVSVEESVSLGDNWFKLLKIVQDIRDKGRRE
jgi:hypothetical protein